VKFLVIVNESPWGSGLSLAACRFVVAAIESSIEIRAIFFREDGVYNAVTGEATDAGTIELGTAWKNIGESHDVRLILCSSSWQRRLDLLLPAPFEISGLTEMTELMLDSDRVITF